jgi:hypothetical protein
MDKLSRKYVKVNKSKQRKVCVSVALEMESTNNILKFCHFRYERVLELDEIEKER